jgi:rfaE bifunctional protein nucleotidyltransferase chain/domain
MSTPDQAETASITTRLLASAGALRRAAAAAGDVIAAADQITRTFEQNGKVLAVGNGGSASQAQHLVAELLGRYSVERSGLRAIALSADSVAITAIANDDGFETVFARQVHAFGDAVDTLIAFSTSGRSPNIIECIRAAKRRGMATIFVTGPNPDPSTASTADVFIAAPAESTALIQECHLVVIHVLTELVERRMFGASMPYGRPKLTTIQELLPSRGAWRRANLTVVWTNGCFDLVHAGHIRSLTEAADLGDVLVVGVNSDESVRRLKGTARPIYPLRDRQEILAGLSVVDHVVALDEDDPRAALEILRPDIHFKGGEYRDPASLIEKPTTDWIGARIVLGRHWPEYATTDTILTIVDRHRLVAEDEAEGVLT